METIVYNVRDLSGTDRTAVERLVGHPLQQDQQLVIQVVSVERAVAECGDATNDGDLPSLPEWCNVYAGLSDEEIAVLERAISRRLDLTRPAT